jgi:hypothetical protein
MNLEIKHNENHERGIFYMKNEGKTIAELTYSIKEDVMTIDHTEVHPDHEGNGLGTKLNEECVAFAKANHRKIYPLCPFSEVLFDNNDDWSDLRV